MPAKATTQKPVETVPAKATLKRAPSNDKIPEKAKTSKTRNQSLKAEESKTAPPRNATKCKCKSI